MRSSVSSTNKPFVITTIQPLIIISLIVLSLVTAPPVHAYSTNMNASVVIGQQNFTSNSENQGGSAAANTLKYAYGSVVINEVIKCQVRDIQSLGYAPYGLLDLKNSTGTDIKVWIWKKFI